MMVGDRGQERAGLIRREALHFGAHDARGIGERRGVLRDELPLDGAVERDAEHGAEVLTRPRRQPGLTLLIEEGVDVFRLEPAESQMAEPWHEMQAHELRVTVMRFRADGRVRTVSIQRSRNCLIVWRSSPSDVAPCCTARRLFVSFAATSARVAP